MDEIDVVGGEYEFKNVTFSFDRSKKVLKNIKCLEQ